MKNEKFYEILKIIKAVIFDMDGLLVRSEEAWIASEREFLARRGIHVAEALRREMAPLLAGRNQQEAAQFYKARFNLKDPLKAIKRERMELAKTHFEKVPLCEGVMELLNALKGARLKLALASGSPKEFIRTILDRFDLWPYFQAVISGDQVPRSKPNPYIYHLAAKDLCVLPRYCLVFEDAPNGVEAAKAAGMMCALIPNKLIHNPDAQKADFVFDSLTAIDLEKLKRALSDSN